MKIGVVGLGSIGKRHANNLINMGHEVYGYDPAYPDGIDKIKPLAAAMDGIDAYVIASPTKFHIEHMIEYAKTGKPLFIEKPIADKLIMLAPPQTRMIGYNLRYHACVVAAKNWISKGEIGEPLWANLMLGQFSSKPDYLRDGVILNWSHEIDLALYLLGPAEVKAALVRAPNDRDDMADILLRHENGTQSVVHLDYLSEPEVRQGFIGGTQGQIIFNLLNRQAWLRSPHNEILDHITGYDDFDMNYREEIKEFIDLVEGKETSGVHCTAEEALAVLEICMTARKQAGL